MKFRWVVASISPKSWVHVVRCPPAVVALAVGLALALAARLVADWSDTYFAHLGWAAAGWIGGSAVWLAYFVPKLLRD